MGENYGAIMINVNPNQPLNGSCPWPDFEELYNDVMDSSFDVLGRNITLHLHPVQTAASGVVQSTKRVLQYNPYLGRAPRPAPMNISTSRTPAARFVPRDVIYKAHIRHGPTESSHQDTGIDLDINQAATTTVVEAIPHISEAESATIDGSRYQVFSPPREIGLGTLRYAITVWERVAEKENPS